MKILIEFNAYYVLCLTIRCIFHIFNICSGVIFSGHDQSSFSVSVTFCKDSPTLLNGTALDSQFRFTPAAYAETTTINTVEGMSI